MTELSRYIPVNGVSCVVKAVPLLFCNVFGFGELATVRRP